MNIKTELVRWAIILGICVVVLNTLYGVYNSEDKVEMEVAEKDICMDYDVRDIWYDEDGVANVFRDKYGRSYGQTILYGDITDFVLDYTPNEWINFVRNGIWYKSDGDYDVFYTAEELLERRMGDCEDKALLMAKGLKVYGFDTALALFDGHVVCFISKEQVDNGYMGIKKGRALLLPIWKDVVYTDSSGKEWLPIESTSNGNIGQLKNIQDVYLWYVL